VLHQHQHLSRRCRRRARAAEKRGHHLCTTPRTTAAATGLRSRTNVRSNAHAGNHQCLALEREFVTTSHN
jgi:hypothetical protein